MFPVLGYSALNAGLPFFLTPDMSDEARAKMKEFQTKQQELIDKLRKDELKRREDVYNLYKQSRDIVSIQNAEAYKFYVSNIFGNYVNSVFTQGLPFGPRSILKLYSPDCPFCVKYVDPLSSIAPMFPPGSIVALDVKAAMADAYLRSVVDQLGGVGWDGRVPAWFLMEPDATGSIVFSPFSLPSWGELSMGVDVDQARYKLASLLKEKLVANQIAKNISEVKAESYVRMAKDSLKKARVYGNRMTDEREAIRRILEAEADDPVSSQIQRVVRSLKRDNGERVNLLGMDDESLALTLMETRVPPLYPSMDRLSVLTYLAGLSSSGSEKDEKKEENPTS